MGDRSKVAKAAGAAGMQAGAALHRIEAAGTTTGEDSNSRETAHRIQGEALYGVSPITAALAAGRRQLYTLYIQEGLEAGKRKDMGACQAAIAAAQALGVETCDVAKHDLNLACGDRPHQGLVLDCEPLRMDTLTALPVPRMQPGQPWPLWLALDEIQDPQNLGAILRSAHFLGASGVLCCAKNSAPLSPVVAKASAGALDAMTLYSCGSMPRFLTSAAEAGWTVVGADVHEGSTDLATFTLSSPTLLVLGSEGRGLRPLVRQACQQALRIGPPPPPQGSPGMSGVDSLNVSVAAGVMLHHLLHSRARAGVDSVGAQTGEEPSYNLSGSGVLPLDSVKTELAGVASEELGAIA
ncbi:hypothetical protein WJX73_010517 [Symbiochloris irregularis]|uniref:rRNA methyltransferase 1, mitochondrial n=1 Tax=Symbiochloris irregularis TaxID=706552 RepID=A0AAW1P842_9CHLO